MKSCWSTFLRQPLVGASVLRLRQALRDYGANQDIDALMTVVRDLHAQQALPAAAPTHMPQHPPITRADLHLICYEYIV